jgi:hypothetical protein
VKEAIYEPGPRMRPPALPVMLIRVNGMIQRVSSIGTRKSILFLIPLLKKQNSYSVITKGRVNAFSFDFIARTAERKDMP